MRSIKLIAALLGIRSASRSRSCRRRPVAPRSCVRDWLLEDRSLLAAHGLVNLAVAHGVAHPLAKYAIETSLHAPSGPAPGVLPRIQHQVATQVAAHATTPSGKQPISVDGIQDNHGKDHKGAKATAPEGSTDGMKSGSGYGETNSTPPARSRYAIAGAATPQGSTNEGDSPLVSAGGTDVQTTGDSGQSTASSQAVASGQTIAQGHSAIVQSAKALADTMTHGSFGDVNRDDRAENQSPSQGLPGPTGDTTPEAQSGMNTGTMDFLGAFGAAEKASAASETPSVSSFIHVANAFVTAMYRETFDRMPEVVELKLWSRHLKAGVDPRVVAWHIWNSPEHRRLERHGMIAAKAFQRSYKDAVTIGRQAVRDQLSLPAGPLSSSAGRPSTAPAVASRAGDARRTSSPRHPGSLLQN